MHDKANIYFLGIGGIGMSALARYFLHMGKQVAGYDKVRNPQCEALEALGAQIHYEDDIALIPKKFTKDNTLVIYTPAIPAEHREFLHLQETGYTLRKRAAILGDLAKTHRCLAVAGTHGKTTTSALLAHLFVQAERKINAFLGGVAVNVNSNFIAGDPDEVLIAEADEFDRSFLTLHPDGAVITSTDADHLDIYGDAESLKHTFAAFAKSVQTHVLLNENVLLEGGTPYGFHPNSPYRAENVRIEHHNYVFDLVLPGHHTLRDIKTGLPGRHNVENAVAAAGLAINYGLTPEQIKAGIESFRGVKRRFEYHIKTDDLVYIDDYAHHPTEISALIKSVKELYPNKRITGIFQPHLYSRTRDFADGFAESLSLVDQLILMEIYPAREKPIPGIHAGMLLEKASVVDKVRMSEGEILEHVKMHKPEVILTIGAGDIDQLIAPLKMSLLNG
jgi:UDP-N-acetylmuramate--alanine ligase